MCWQARYQRRWRHAHTSRRSTFIVITLSNLVQWEKCAIRLVTGKPWVEARGFRCCDKYGKLGYRYILLEAGHIGQNMYLVSEALGLKCCALGGTRDENLEKLIDIDGVTEAVVYGFAVGR